MFETKSYSETWAGLRLIAVFKLAYQVLGLSPNLVYNFFYCNIKTFRSCDG